MLLISFIAILASLKNIVVVLYNYHKSKLKYDSIRELHISNKSSKGTDENYRYIKLKNINSDYIAWIKIDGTKIDYPVAKGTDNKFYLSHNFYKEKDSVGCIFMDNQNSGTNLDKNIIIYGHNMRDKSMFGRLNNYLDKSFYNGHKFITLEFLGNKYEYKIFSVYTTTESTWISIYFNDDIAFNQYLSEVTKKSVFNNTKDLSVKDKILTLSSCTNNGVKRERVVVHAVLKKVGEVK